MTNSVNITRSNRESAPQAVQMAVFAVSMIVVAIAVFYCVSRMDNGEAAYASHFEVPGIAIEDAAPGAITGPANAIAVKDSLAVTHLQCTRNCVEGSRPVLAIVGRVVNNSAAEINGAVIEVVYYNEAGHEIGHDVTQVGRLTAGACTDLSLVSSLNASQAFDAAYFDVVSIAAR